MRVFRICKARWASTAFTGEGSRRFSGRWHDTGTLVVYTATSRALAVLEVLVHVDATLLPDDLVLIPADVPDDVTVETLERGALPRNWNAIPEPPATRALGSDWVRGRSSVALRVPSVVVDGELNVLLNPAHPDFARVVIGTPEPFRWDPRVRQR